MVTRGPTTCGDDGGDGSLTWLALAKRSGWSEGRRRTPWE